MSDWTDCIECRYYDSSVDACNCDDKCYIDGVREFLVWYSGGETMPSFGRYANYNIDNVIAEWQKGN